MCSLAKTRVALLAVFGWALLALSAPALGETITLTGGERFVNSSHGKGLERIYREAFQRLGYELLVVGYPSQRAVVMGDRGEVDGQLERGYDFSLEHPSLVRVEEPTNTEAYSAFAARPGLSVNGWNGLRSGQYSVVARRGVGKAVETLNEIVPKGKLTYVERPEQALAVLLKGRADLYIDYVPLVGETLANLRQSESGNPYADVYVAGVMARTTHHAFLHNRHAMLAPKLALVLKDMKREGLFAKLRDQAAVMP